MDQKPLVSVIITNYNYGQYIAEAVESVLGQSYQPVELVVVDDGSTDESVSILKTFGQRIKLIEQSNQGVVAARNHGLAEALGELVCFLDADDTLDLDFALELVPILQNTYDKTAVAYCDVQYFDQLSVRISANTWNWRKLLYRNYIPITSLIKKTALVEVGGFSQQLHQQFSFEDWDLWLKLAEFGYDGVYVPKTLFYYRYHGKGRNAAGHQHRVELERELSTRHPLLYKRWDARLYLAFWGNLSRLRNLLQKPPGIG